MSGDAQARPATNRRDVIVAVGVSLALRLALVPLNTGEYTDGILQLTGYDRPNGLYPPMFGVWSRVVGKMFLGAFAPETAGRILSAVSGAAVVGIVWAIAHRLAGRRAAAWAAAMMALNPLALRWSVHAMTDSLFVALATYALLEMQRGTDPVTPPEEGTGVRRGGKRAHALFGAFVYTYLATMTRYQGALLYPLGLAAFFVLIRSSRYFPTHAFMGVLFVFPIWVIFMGRDFAHGKQFADRASVGTLAQQALAWLNTAESFVLVSPYYFGYPLAAWALVALVARVWTGPGSAGGASWARFAALQAVWGGGLLAAHSAFGSFQYRYMLPLLPGVAVVAGAGLARAEEWAARVQPSGRPCRRRGALLSAARIVTLVHLIGFSAAVLWFQREATGDQKAAAKFVAAKVAPGTPVFSNERYGDFWNLECVKGRFWSGREIKSILRAPETSAPGGLAAGPTLAPLPTGAVLMLSNAYGGDEALGALFAELQRRYRLAPLPGGRFRATVIPLHDDVMVDGAQNQNPVGWVMRYVPQRFQTGVFVVEGPAPGAEANRP